MSVLNKLKKLTKKKDHLNKQSLLLKENILKEKKFFLKSIKLQLLEKASLELLAIIAKELLDDNVSSKINVDFLRNDKRAKVILKFTNNEMNDDAISDIIKECYNDEENIDINKYLNENALNDNILNNVSLKNDIDSKYNENKTKNLLSQIGIIALSSSYSFEKESINTYKELLRKCVKDVNDLLIKHEHPSRYRTKYLQKLIRNTYYLISLELVSLKKGYQDTKSEYSNIDIKTKLEKIKDAFKKLDDILIAITVLTTLYIKNRKTLQKHSRESLKNIRKNITCNEDSIDPVDINIKPEPITIDTSSININCPINKDNITTPHIPLSLKMENVNSCEISQNKEITPEIKDTEELDTFAIIKNLKEKDKLTINLSVDSLVSQSTIIGKIGGTPFYSPVNGYIDKITKNEIVIRNIFDSDEDFLMKQIDLLSQKYERLNNVKLFLKQYYTLVLYPSLLSISILDDSSTFDTYSGVESQWKNALKENEIIDKNFEKNIKRITDKDNVEKHAKNETLYKIKEDVEKETELFYNNLDLIGKRAENQAKVTKSKSSEFILLEYYALRLSSVFNTIENPNDLEIEFRDKINEIIRKRLIVDDYKKKTLSNKINDLIKKIEKGASPGNWFEKALKNYDEKKSIKDLENWLNGLANKNNKLDSNERNSLVKQTIFLFNLYLDYDKLVEKYNILKKETTSKKETIKEGLDINSFLNNLWLEYKNLNNEILEIQKLVDSLSLFQTYSIVTYEEKRARLYTIADTPKCDIKNDNFKRSKHEYTDIEYWLKYCSFATLASVTNPITGWSTGWIFPNPILLPVIYIPIKPINTKWGLIVLGISICGLWIYPWVLTANLTSSYNVAVGDPVRAIRNEIDALKKEISEQISKFKKITIQKFIDINEKKIDSSQKNIKKYRERILEIKANKPSQNKILEYENWTEELLKAQELLKTEQINLWKLETKQKMLKDAKSLGTSLKETSEEFLDKTEKSINSKLDDLSSLVGKLNKVVAALPNAMEPYSVNFGMTLKNLNPVILIEDELDDNINEGPLKEIFDKFKINEDELTNLSFSEKIKSSIVNYDIYDNALSLANLLMIKKDVFPKYEKLDIKNVPWITFLYKNFVTTGAKTFGWPGYAPFPI